ncbi:MAG: site-2 protease family protein [Thermoplasmatota archaeon]|jgi:membrane-associated protease RseP (regulator of RpoE activity)
MAIIESLLIFSTIILVYALIVYILYKKEVFKKYNLSFYGPALLLRTKRGINLLKKIASKKKFWKKYGNFGIVFCFIIMVIMVIVLIWQAWTVIGFTPAQKKAMPGFEIALILPGINPILPLEYIGYIIVALIVAVIAHEFSHGILTFVGNLKVKSLGILYLIIPIGAFCEPDEEELKKTETGKRMRVYAAGPLSNFSVALIAILLFSFIFMSAVQPQAEGIGVLEVYKNSPADEIGIKTGAIITELNGTNFSDIKTFEQRYNKYIEILNNTKANETVSISYVYNHVYYSKTIKLTDRYNYFPVESNKGKGFTGVYSLIGVKENLNILKNPFFEKFPYGFLFFYVIPLTGYFEGYNPIVSPFTESYVITGPIAVFPPILFWIIVNTLYWIFWLNLAVGLFNVLPMIPLDGGFLFNDVMHSLVKKLKMNASEETRNKIVKNISFTISMIILIAIIFPFIIKYI